METPPLRGARVQARGGHLGCYTHTQVRGCAALARSPKGRGPPAASLQRPARLAPCGASWTAASARSPSGPGGLPGTSSAPHPRAGTATLLQAPGQASFASQPRWFTTAVLPRSARCPRACPRGAGTAEAPRGYPARRPPRAGSAGWGAGGIIGCKLTPLTLCPPTPNSEQTWVPHRAGPRAPHILQTLRPPGVTPHSPTPPPDLLCGRKNGAPRAGVTSSGPAQAPEGKGICRDERVGGWGVGAVFSLPALFWEMPEASRARNVRPERTPPLHADI